MIKKKLQYIFKRFFQLVFQLIYGKIVYKENNLIDEDIKMSLLEGSKIKKFDNTKYTVYEIKNGIVYNDHVENVAIINKNKILDKISYQQIRGKLCESKFSNIINKGTPRIKRRIKGNLLILSQGASGNDNYFHWLFDILPKIKIFSELYDLNNLDNLYFSKLKSYQKNILKIMNLNNLNIIDSKMYRHVQADKIYALEHPWYNKGYILEEVNNIPKWIIEWLRETFLTKRERFNSNEKIYVDRSESRFNHCQIINNNEVSTFLESKGFTKYKVGQLPFQKQIHLFKNAKVVVGAHGAAFANLVFCEPGTKVIEMKPENHPNFINKKISEFINLNYRLIETPILKNKERGDMIVNLDQLDKILD
jgi:capsular polysaccharide biosynthesis protein